MVCNPSCTYFSTLKLLSVVAMFVVIAAAQLAGRGYSACEDGKGNLI